MQKSLFPVLICAALAAIPGQLRAEEQEADAAGETTVQPGANVIRAHQLEILLDRKLRAIGDAEIQQDDKRLKGDRIYYNLLNEELHVVGNARLEQNGNVISGPDLRIRLKEREGEMQEPVFVMRKALQPTQGLGLISATSLASGDPGRIAAPVLDARQQASRDANGQEAWTRGSSRGDAKLLVFEGPDRERLYGARYTTCEVGVDDWYLRAGELELNHHSDTGTAKHASIEFKGVPILYTPWVDFPFYKQRKSGFLSPSFGTTTRSGVELAVPYYWNIAPDMDATLTPRVLSKRGLQLQGEYRYLGETYSGQDNLEFLSNDQQADRDRWFARLQHHHNFGNGWSGGYNIERVSDDQYFSDLSTSILTTSRVNLPQEGNVSYNSENWSFTGLVQKFQTLDGISYPYERLPQLTLNGSQEWQRASGNLYAQWSRFERADGAPVTTTPVPGGAALTTSVSGSRFVAYPSVSVPITQSYGYLTSKLGLHYTRYSLDNPEYWLGTDPNVDPPSQYQSDSRSLPIFSLDGGLYFDRDFRVVKNMYTQTLEPRLYYVYIPYRDQSDLPVFDSGVTDLSLGSLFTENAFSGNDRINDANQISLGLTSRLIDQRTGIQRLAVTVGQRFYFADRKVALPGGEERTSSSSDLVAALTARLRNFWNVDAAWQYDTDLDRTVKSNLGMRYNPAPGKSLNMSYRFIRDSLEQIDLSSQWPLGSSWYGLARWNYSLEESRPIEGLLGAEYNAGCWQARAVLQRVSTATADANYAFFFQLELDGLASVGTSPLSLLKRSIPGYQSSALIPDSFAQ